MNRPLNTTRRQRTLAVAAALLGALVMFFGILATTPAQAISPHFSFSDFKAERRGVATDPELKNHDFHRWDWAELTFNWKSERPDGTVKDGDSFKLILPTELNFHSVTFPLIDKNSGKHGGTCESVSSVAAAESTLTCTFDDQLEGLRDVHGEVKISAQAWEETNQTSLEITTTTGKNLTVELSSKGIQPRKDSDPATSLYKTGWPEQAVHPVKNGEVIDWSNVVDTLRWEVRIPFSEVQGVDEIIVTDTLVSAGSDPKVKGHKFLPSEYKRSNAVPDAGQPHFYDAAHVQTFCRPRTEPECTFPVKYTWLSDTQAEFKIKKPATGWPTEGSLQLQYSTHPTSDSGLVGSYLKGDLFKNKVTVLGRELDRTIEVKRDGKGSYHGVERNSFELQKKVVFDAQVSDEVRARVNAAEFKVRVEIDSDIPTLVATDKLYDLTIKADGAPVRGLKELNVGDKVTLKEIELPTIEGVEWGIPQFGAGEGIELRNGGKTAVATVKSGENVKVLLTNTAKPTTPPPTEPPTTVGTPKEAPKSSLPRTGVTVSSGLAAAAGMLVAGSLILLARRYTAQ